jgi:hypothetical protein
MKMSMDIGEMILTGENRISLRNTCPSTTLNITHQLIFLLEATRVFFVVGTESSCVMYVNFSLHNRERSILFL